MSIEKHGVCGINNIKESCYSNSALQCLLATKCLREYFLNRDIPKRIGRNIGFHKEIEDTVTYQLLRLFRAAGDGDPILTPLSFCKTYRSTIPNFAEGQQDAQEFLSAVLNIVHRETHITETNQKKFDHIRDQLKILSSTEDREIITGTKLLLKETETNNRSEYLLARTSLLMEAEFGNTKSVYTDAFFGSVMEIISCSNCDGETQKFCREDVLILRPLGAVTNIANCISDRFGESALDGFKCESCGSGTVKLNSRLVSRPKILVVLIAEYDSGYVTNCETLDLTEYCDPNGAGPTKYRTYASIHHIGHKKNGGCGHYVANFKVLDNNRHYTADDASVYLRESKNLHSKGYVLLCEGITN